MTTYGALCPCDDIPIQHADDRAAQSDSPGSPRVIFLDLPAPPLISKSLCGCTMILILERERELLEVSTPVLLYHLNVWERSLIRWSPVGSAASLVDERGSWNRAVVIIIIDSKRAGNTKSTQSQSAYSGMGRDIYDAIENGTVQCVEHRPEPDVVFPYPDKKTLVERWLFGSITQALFTTAFFYIINKMQLGVLNS
ncbi:hypothetical protein B0H13DRAFT_1904418 [Mycena leptocephala]|nr:hypothetical protein B0H13DRAFT_1904418 [Mycena leptocephala]